MSVHQRLLQPLPSAVFISPCLRRFPFRVIRVFRGSPPVSGPGRLSARECRKRHRPGYQESAAFQQVARAVDVAPADLLRRVYGEPADGPAPALTPATGCEIKDAAAPR